MNKKKLWIPLVVMVVLAAVAVVLILTLGGKNKTVQAPELNPGDPDCVHEYADWEPDTEASCTTEGYDIRTCKRCGKQESRAIAAYGHEFDDGECEECGQKEWDCDHDDTMTVVIMKPTCTDKGEKREICEKCLAVVRIRSIAATGHEETTEKLCYPATCDTNGLKQVICQTCGQIAEEIVIPSEGHLYAYVGYQDATCVEVGHSDYWECSKCGKKDSYTVIAPYGHDFHWGNCQNCDASDSSFTTLEGLTYELTFHPGITKEIASYSNSASYIASHDGSMTASGQRDNYNFTVKEEGRYCIWVDGMTDNAAVELYLYDSDEWITRDTYAVNGDMIYATLSAGDYYVQVRQDSKYSDYTVHIAYQKAYVDISAYDIVYDAIEYNEQAIIYTFTPSQSGYYFFELRDMQSDSYMCIYIYDSANNRVDYDTWIKNGEGTVEYLAGGEQYRIVVVNCYDVITDYSLYIQKAQPAVDMDGYTSINGEIQHAYQQNIYTFTALQSECSVYLNGMDSIVELYIYDCSGEMIDQDTYCRNNEGLVCTGLEVGQQYCIMVGCYSVNTPYTLHLIYPRETMEVTDNCAVEDSITVIGVDNLYELEVSEDGNLEVYLYFSDASETSWLSVYIYNAGGEWIGSRTMYNGYSVTVFGVQAGETIFICVENNGATAEYTILFELEDNQ